VNHHFIFAPQAKKLNPRVPYRETHSDLQSEPGTKPVCPSIMFVTSLAPLVTSYEVHNHTIELIGVLELSPVTTTVEEQQP
jgi:hypothetical protein